MFLLQRPRLLLPPLPAPWALTKDGPFVSISPLGQGTRLQPEGENLGGWH